MNNGFRGFPQGQIFNQGNGFRAWRVRNIVPATGTDGQWLCYEMDFGIGGVSQTPSRSGLPISSTYPSQVYLAFDGNFTLFANVTSNAVLYSWIGINFGQELPIDSVTISNLNNGSNVPPILYAIDASNDLRNWQTIWETQPGEIGTVNSATYTSNRPY